MSLHNVHSAFFCTQNINLLYECLVEKLKIDGIYASPYTQYVHLTTSIMNHVWSDIQKILTKELLAQEKKCILRLNNMVLKQSCNIIRKNVQKQKVYLHPLPHPATDSSRQSVETPCNRFSGSTQLRETSIDELYSQIDDQHIQNPYNLYDTMVTETSLDKYDTSIEDEQVLYDETTTTLLCPENCDTIYTNETTETKSTFPVHIQTFSDSKNNEKHVPQTEIRTVTLSSESRDTRQFPNLNMYTLQFTETVTKVTLLDYNIHVSHEYINNNNNKFYFSEDTDAMHTITLDNGNPSVDKLLVSLQNHMNGTGKYRYNVYKDKDQKVHFELLDKGVFSLYFQQTLYNIGNILGFRSRDYKGKRSYTSTQKVSIAEKPVSVTLSIPEFDFTGNLNDNLRGSLLYTGSGSSCTFTLLTFRFTDSIRKSLVNVGDTNHTFVFQLESAVTEMTKPTVQSVHNTQNIHNLSFLDL